MIKYASYIISMTELDDGSRLFAKLTDVAPKNLKVGIPIQVTQHQIEADRLTYKFKPL